MEKAMKKVEEMIADRSIFIQPDNALALAKELGFTVVNAELNSADGFMLVDEQEKIEKFDSHKVIGVNVKNELQSKKAFIVQELAHYVIQKKALNGEPLKIAQKDTLKLRSDDVKNNLNNIQQPLFKVKGKRLPTEMEKEVVLKSIGNILNVTFPMAQQIEQQDIDSTEAERLLVEQYYATRFQSDKKDIVATVTSSSVDSDEALGLKDVQTPEQLDRDKEITRLLGTYVDLYKIREMQRIVNRKRLTWFCIFLTSILVVASIVLMIMWLPIVASQYPMDDTAATGTVEASETPNPEATKKTKNFTFDGFLISAAAAQGTDNATATPTLAATEEAATVTPEPTEMPEPTEEPGPTEEPDVATQVKAALDDYYKGDAATENIEGGFINSILKTVLESNASTGAKDIVAMLSVLLIILGSVFLLLRMLFKYVLPTQEEERM